jgi:hypothetical protein
MKPLATDGRWLRALWIGTLVALSAGLTTTYTCIVPFAALSVAAAMTLSRREAVVATAAVWFANQAAGFVGMSYPWTASTIGWGAAIGAAAIAGTLAAQWLLRRLGGWRPRTQVVTAFALAFAVYESMLYAAALSLRGTGAFAPGIMAQVLIVNVVTLGGLWALNQLLAVASSSYRRRVSPSPARFA